MDTICCRHDDTRDDVSADGSNRGLGGKILECDYDTTCTKLYKMIEGKKWDEIIYFLETAKWYFDTSVFTSIFFGSGPDPRFVETRTWVTALDEMGSVRWCQLPLHAAITFQAPFEVIKKLVDVYPESIRCADDQDMLPLHYAFRFGSVDKVLAYILEEFPQASKKKALRDRLPLDMAHYSSRPERGVIIDCYVETAIADAKAEWGADNEDALMNVEFSSNAEMERAQNELREARKNIKQLKEKLGGRRGLKRGGADDRDEMSLDSTEEVIVSKKSSRSFGKIFGRQKNKLISF